LPRGRKKRTAVLGHAYRGKHQSYRRVKYGVWVHFDKAGGAKKGKEKREKEALRRDNQRKGGGGGGELSQKRKKG